MPRKKPFKYELSDLISEYNEELYQEISEQIPIELVKGVGSWSAYIDRDNDKAIITYSKSEVPDACFAHELLHIKLELNGLKDPFVRSNEEKVTWSDIRFFINQLAHHRMYSEFLEMGFTEDEFLNDNDQKETLRLLKRDIPMLEKLHKSSGNLLFGFAVLYPYMVCISPNEDSETVKEYLQRLKNISEPEFIQKAEAIIESWNTSVQMDYCLTLAKIFKIGNYPRISFTPQDDINNETKSENVEV